MTSFRYIPNEVRIEDWGESFTPILDFSVAAWTADSVLCLARVFDGSSIDWRVRESILRVTMAVARFVPSNYAQPSGEPFSSFSMCQMAAELGLDASSTQGVQRSLRVLALASKTRDGASYSEACERLRAARHGVPFLEKLRQSPRKATVWALVGAGPRLPVDEPHSPTSPAPHHGDTHDSATGDGTDMQKTVAGAVESHESVVESHESAVESHESAVADGRASDTAHRRSSCRDSDRLNCVDADCRHGHSPQLVVETNAIGKRAATTSTLFSPSLTLSEWQKEEGYRQLLRLVPCGPGNREQETRKAYNRRLEQGYTPEALIEGAKRHLSTAKGRDRTRFPFHFLDTDALFHSCCGEIPECIRLSYLARIEGAWWYNFSHGRDLDPIECPSEATSDEALKAVERMVISGVKSL